MVRGSELSADVRREALASYVHRFTGDNRPEWARQPMPNGRAYPLQFRSDSEWLANTDFPVTAAGRLVTRSGMASDCYSRPTWPEDDGTGWKGREASERRGGEA